MFIKHSGFALFGIALVTILSMGAPILAQEIQLGNDTNIDLDEDETELKPRFSLEDGRLNVRVEEQSKPETKIKLGNGRVEISEEQEPARERLNFSIPTIEKK